MIFTCLSLAHKTIDVKIVFRLRLEFTITRAEYVQICIWVFFFLRLPPCIVVYHAGSFSLCEKINLSFFSRDSGEPFSLSNGSCEMILFRNSQGETLHDKDTRQNLTFQQAVMYILLSVEKTERKNLNSL